MSKLRNDLILVLVIFLSFVISGCASIMSSGYQKVDIQSDPSEAAVKITNESGKVVFDSHTPASLNLGRGDGFFKGAKYTIEISKQGYKTEQLRLESNLNWGWYLIGNFLIGGLLGWIIIDPATGGMWYLTPDKVNPHMAQEASFLNQKDGLMIVLLKDVPTDVAKEMKPIPVQD